MTTFSQMVDELTIEHVRPDLRVNIATYLNQTVRELHVKTQGSNESMPVFYADNRVEDELTVAGADSNNGIFTWDLPNLNRLQSIEAVWYDGSNRYAKQGNPRTIGIHRNSEPDNRFYYYRAGSYIAFSGHGGDDQTIRISYFLYLPSLPYYSATDRPCTWDPISQTYSLTQAGTLAGLTLDQAMALTTHWALERHEDAIKEGIRAKVFKRISDMDRARLSYSAFEAMRGGVINSESIDYDVTYAR